MATHFSGRVLIVDDDEDIREIFASELSAHGFIPTAVADIESMQKALLERFYDAVLLDVFLNNENGLDALPFLVKNFHFTKVIMMSASGTIEIAVDAMKKGASTYISKTKNAAEIIGALQIMLNSGRTTADESASKNWDKYGIVGKSPEIRTVLKQIEQVCNVPSNVLIIGESGTGKELVARAIHNTSHRNSKRFAAINCAAIPENLLESELFGHKKGAFTGATNDRKGVFELSSGGTLFLDEIGEMPLNLQVKLLRAIQEKEITPVGSSQTIAINTRILAATNRNPREALRDSQIRPDLYYRLSVITIHLPALKDRTSDIPVLVNYFLDKYCSQFEKVIKRPTEEVMAKLVNYTWPGNVRELQNAIERAVVLSVDGAIHTEDLFDHSDTFPTRNQQGTHLQDSIFDHTLSRAKRDFEKEYLKHLLHATHGNITNMAKISNRYRADIYRLLSKHGLDMDEFRFDSLSES